MTEIKGNNQKTEFTPFDPSLISKIMDALDTSDRIKVVSLTKNLSAADIADIINLIPRSEVKNFIGFHNMFLGLGENRHCWPASYERF